jgi:hypothetical protein
MAELKGTSFIFGTKTYPTSKTKYEKSITVNSPPDKVADVIEDISKATEWMAGLREFRLISGEPNIIGARMYYRIDQLGYVYEGTCEITKHVHSKEYEITNTEEKSKLVSIDRFNLQDMSGKTKVTWTIINTGPKNVDVALKALDVKKEHIMPFAGKTALKFFVHAWQTTSLNHLRRIVEQS